MSCPAASASAWPSRAHWSGDRSCCWPTSRPAISTAARPREIMALFRELHAEGQTLIIVTHDPGDRRSYCRRIMRLHDGRIVEDYRRMPTAGRRGGVMSASAVNVAADRGGRFQGSWYAVQECLRSALASIRAHGLRSFLTMLGDHNRRRFGDLRDRAGAGTVAVDLAAIPGARRQHADAALVYATRGSDARQVQSSAHHGPDGTAAIASMASATSRRSCSRASGSGAQVRNGRNTANGQIFGTTSHYQDVQQMFPNSGRFLTDSDDASRRRVVVLGEQMRKDLKLPQNSSGPVRADRQRVVQGRRRAWSRAARCSA